MNRHATSQSETYNNEVKTISIHKIVTEAAFSTYSNDFHSNESWISKVKSNKNKHV